MTADDILDAVDRHRDSAWTMASIAKELGVSEPAIYYHFPSKHALLVELGARVMRTLQLPSDDLDWEAWLEAFALEFVAVVRRHPFLHDVDMAAVVTLQPTSVGLVDKALETLVARGFDLEPAALALQTVLLVAQALSAPTRLVETAVLHDIASVTDAPLAKALYADAASLDPDRILRRLLQVALAGIRVELAPQQDRPRRGTKARAGAVRSRS